MNNNEENDIKNKVFLKINFYIMSLWLLFIIIFFLSVDVPISFEPNASFIGFSALLSRNILSIIALILSIISWWLACRIQYEWSGASNPPHLIDTVKNENYEYLTFLTTYIIPLICIDLKSVRYVVVLGVLLLLIGWIFVKMDLYYGNPTLALMGYRLYRGKIKGVEAADGIILISKDRLSSGVAIKWIKIDEYVWVVKEVK